MGFFGFLSMVGSVVGALVLVGGLASAKGAPQEAAVAACAVALAVLPYVFFRVLQLNAQEKQRTAFYEAIRQSLDILEKRP